jgi:hypothetical protein
VIINEKRFTIFRTIDEARFWQTLTAYSGPVDIGKTKMARGIRSWYSWAKYTSAEKLTLVYIILEGPDTAFLCYINDEQHMKFHHADFKSGYAVEKEELKEDNELMNEETQFKMDVFEHYYFIMETSIMKTQSSDHTTENHIEASWALAYSESSCVLSASRDSSSHLYSFSVKHVELNTQGLPAAILDHEKRGSDSATLVKWEQFVKDVKVLEILNGTVKMGYKQFSDCRRMLSQNLSFEGRLTHPPLKLNPYDVL